MKTIEQLKAELVEAEKEERRTWAVAKQTEDNHKPIIDKTTQEWALANRKLRDLRGVVDFLSQRNASK